MIHPSYNELSDAINSGNVNEEPVVNSRYSVCVATAKRARQLIDGAEPLTTPHCNKPLSTAIDELYEGKVTILAEEPAEAGTEADIYAEESENA